MRKIICLILGLIIVLNVGASSLVNAKTNDKKNDNEKQYKEEKVISDDAEIKEYLEKHPKLKEKVSMEVDKGAGLESIYSVRVYVSEETEQINGENVVKESHIMSKDEVEKMKKDSIVSTSTLQSGGAKYYLDITLVRFNMGSYKYTIDGHAEWASLGMSSEKYPAIGEDVIALTWGGDGELKATSKGAAGKYAISNQDVNFNLSKSDYQKGYAWNFKESIPIGFHQDFAKWITCTVNLQKTYTQVKNKETGVRLTYIHTYKTYNPGVSFSGSGVPQVSLSGTTSQWTLETDLPGFQY